MKRAAGNIALGALLLLAIWLILVLGSLLVDWFSATFGAGGWLVLLLIFPGLPLLHILGKTFREFFQ